MPWLVDGMNVIGSRPDGWWRDRTAAMARLVSALAALGEGAYVVLDGRERDLAVDPGDVTVVWAPHADDVIAGLVEEAREPSRWTVVTSDRELVDRVRAAGAQVTGSSGFRERLEAGR
ncbi:MAG: NYN domain-containing protein [Myxococcales bacterium]|jgi:hypothetical protein